jgi:hypothetical protein
VLIDLKGIYFIGIHLINIYLAGGTTQKVDTYKLNNRRIEQIALISVLNAE